MDPPSAEAPRSRARSHGRKERVWASRTANWRRGAKPPSTPSLRGNLSGSVRQLYCGRLHIDIFGGGAQERGIVRPAERSSILVRPIAPRPSDLVIQGPRATDRRARNGAWRPDALETFHNCVIMRTKIVGNRQ